MSTGALREWHDQGGRSNMQGPESYGPKQPNPSKRKPRGSQWRSSALAIQRHNVLNYLPRSRHRHRMIGVAREGPRTLPQPERWRT